MSGDLDHLAIVLEGAAAAHEADVAALANMSEREISYLASVGEDADPDTDGLECDR